MLTDEQKALAERNYAFAPYMAYKARNLPMDWDEALSCAHLGLVKAAGSYDPGKGATFATYAASVIRNELLVACRQEGKHRGLGHLDREATCWDGSCTLYGLVADKGQAIADLEGLLDLQRAFGRLKLTRNERRALTAAAREPGRYAGEMGVSQPYFSQCLGSVRRKLKAELAGKQGTGKEAQALAGRGLGLLSR